jgi:hypothetical protein
MTGYDGVPDAERAEFAQPIGTMEIRPAYLTAHRSFEASASIQMPPERAMDSTGFRAASVTVARLMFVAQIAGVW